MPHPIVVRAPATSANLGSGFDCFGLALDLWNEVVAQPGTETEPDNLILRACRAVFEEVGASYPGFVVESTNRIPMGRGLGSSASAIVCGVLLANHCLGRPLDEPALLRLATRLEGHPDNIAPCLLGGVQVVVQADDGGIVHARVPLGPDLRAVVFVPEVNLSTNHARSVLPASVPLADALFNVARAGLLVVALSTRQYDLLAEATRDRLHQPYRRSLFPAGATLQAAAMDAGALAACTSGAGPAVLTLVVEGTSDAAVLAALVKAAFDENVRGTTMRLKLSERGAHVVVD